MDVFAMVFTTRGRLNRVRHAKYHLIWMMFNILSGFTVLQVTRAFTGDDNLGNLINGTLVYTWLIGALMVSARRLHDLGWDGRFVLATLIPGLNVLLMIYLFLAAGQVGANEYGAEPSEN